jgi:hypothetical protein
MRAKHYPILGFSLLAAAIGLIGWSGALEQVLLGDLAAPIRWFAKRVAEEWTRGHVASVLLLAAMGAATFAAVAGAVLTLAGASWAGYRRSVAMIVAALGLLAFGGHEVAIANVARRQIDVSLERAFRTGTETANAPAESRRIVAEFFAEQRKKTADFANHIVRDGPWTGRDEWVKGEFATRMFGPADVKGTVERANAAFAQAAAAQANATAVAVISQLGELGASDRIVAEAIKARMAGAAGQFYGGAVSYTQSLASSELYNSMWRFAAGTGVGILVGPAMNALAQRMMGSGNLAAIVGGLVAAGIGAGAEAILTNNAITEMQTNLDRMLFEMERKLLQDSVERWSSLHSVWMQDTREALRAQIMLAALRQRHGSVSDTLRLRLYRVGGVL